MKKRWMVVVTGLMFSAASAVVITSSRVEDRIAASRAEDQSAESAGPPEPLSCSPTDRRSIVKALGENYSSDVAANVTVLRCGQAFAYGAVCLSCGSPSPAIFGVLLERETGGGWRYLGSGGPTVIEQLADDAGLERSGLDQLRGRPSR